MTTQRTIKLPNGITVCTETLKVSCDCFAFNAWPWSGKKWPTKHETNARASFSFETEDNETFNLVDVSGDPEGCESEQLRAMSKDCEAILKGVLGNCSFALQVLFSVTWHAALENAKDNGFQAGQNAAAWMDQDMFGGRAKDSKAAAERFLKGIADGDPEILNIIPCSPLSGEWAGDRTAKDIVCDALALDDGEFECMTDVVCALEMEDEFQSLFEQICNVYEERYSDAAQEALVKAAESAI